MKTSLLPLFALVALGLTGTAHAAPPVTTPDDVQYSFTYACDGFGVSVDGHDTGMHTIYSTNHGDPVRSVGHHHVTETHRNLTTGRTVEFRGNYTSTFDYAANTQTFTGAFMIGNEPMRGALLQEVGLVEFNETTGEIRTAGQHDILDLPYDPLCAALAN